MNMNAIYRVVTRIQDQDDFSGSLNDGEFLQYNSTTGKFELEPASISPGGDSGQLQYNSSGSFDGIDHSSIGITGDIFKLSSLAIGDILLVLKGISGQTGNLTEWRNSADSVIASISPSGAATIAGVLKSSGSWSSGGVPAQFGKGTSDADAFIGDRYYFGNGSGFAVGSDCFIGWSDSLDQNGASTNYNLKLYRDAANILALRNDVNAQSFRLYSTFTSNTVHECLQFYATPGANFEIGPKNGSVGGSRRGLTIGSYYESNATITPWLQFTSAGLAIFNQGTLVIGTDDIGGNGLYTKQTNIWMQSWGTHSGVRFMRAEGTAASPTAITDNKLLGFMAVYGYHSGGAFASTQTGGLYFFSAEGYTGSAQGTKFFLRTATVGSAVETDRMTIDGMGVTTFAGEVRVPTASPGTNTTQVASTAFVTEAVASGGGGGSAAPEEFSGTLAVDASVVLTHAADAALTRTVTGLIYDSVSTVLLLNGDGTNGQTTFANVSSNALTITAVSAAVSTSQKKYGTGSISLLNGPYIAITDHSSLGLTGDFCIECWVRFTSVAGVQMLFAKGGDTWDGGGYGLYYSGGTWTFAGIGFTAVNWTNTPSVNTWYHVAVTRSGNTLRLFIDGTRIGSDVTFTSTITRGSSSLFIGQRGDGNPLNGHMDDFRMTTGFPLYTTNFTPPTDALGLHNPFPKLARISDALNIVGLVVEYTSSTTTTLINKCGRNIQYKAVISGGGSSTAQRVLSYSLMGS